MKHLPGPLLALSVFALVWSLAGCGNKQNAKVIFTATLREGPFTESISESGTLEAVNAVDVSTPDISRNFTLIWVVDEGAMVSQGQKIAVFDTADAERDLQSMRDKILDKKDEIENVLAKQRDELTDASNAIQAAKDALEMEGINQRSLEFASDVDKRAGEIKIRSKKEDVGKAERRMATLKLEHQRLMRQKQAELRRLNEDRQGKEEEITACTVYAPRGGLIVYRTRNPWTKDKIRAGDSLRRNQNFLLIPDLSKMQVRMEVNEVDIHRMRTGMACDIVLDAVPDHPFTGDVIKIGKLAYPKPSNNDIMVFEVIAVIRESMPELLRPGMSAKVAVVISRVARATYLPIDALYSVSGTKAQVFTLEGSAAKGSTVGLGVRNEDYAVVETTMPKSTVFLLYHPELDRDPKLDLSKFSIELWQPPVKTNQAPNTNAKAKAAAGSAVAPPAPAAPTATEGADADKAKRVRRSSSGEGGSGSPRGEGGGGGGGFPGGGGSGGGRRGGY